MEEKSSFLRKSRDSRHIPVSDETEKYSVGAFAPIISEGDVSGCVAFIFDGTEPELGETGYKLAQTVAGFLGKQMEA